MSLSVIVGAGTVGTATARLLAAQGNRVRLVSRSGSGPDLPMVERVAADATDAATLTRIADGAAALYNCANPPYHRWDTDWPPLAAAMLAAAGGSGAVLVTASNVYGYGPVEGPMTEDLPLAATTVKGRVRARMWQDALAAHRAGRVRVTEARGADFLGTGAQSPMNDLVLAKVLRGKSAMVPADLDAPHSFTYVGDMARTLVTLADDPRAWGRAWHVPSNPPISIREFAARACALAGVQQPRLSRMPCAVLWMGGLFDPNARGFREMAYQFDRPFVLDSSAATRTFGLRPTPLETVLSESVAQFQP
jgi:nucleoside-diphosphate-sugar epimerase